MGNVKMNNMGRKKAFRIPRMAAAKNAEKKTTDMDAFDQI
jgi:hypothetical protein